MNPLAVIALVAVAGGAAFMFFRKRSSVSQWLADFWAGTVQPPAAFVRRMTGGCTWIVDSGDLVSGAVDPKLDISGNPGAAVRAVTDGVVSWVGTVVGRGPAIGLSSLHVENESFLYIGFYPTVGLGQYVAGDEVIGEALPDSRQLLTFHVVNDRLPDPGVSQPRLDAHAWLRENGTQVTSYIRGWQ
jgi:hypothetical protein